MLVPFSFLSVHTLGSREAASRTFGNLLLLLQTPASGSCVGRGSSKGIAIHIMSVLVLLILAATGDATRLNLNPETCNVWAKGATGPKWLRQQHRLGLQPLLPLLPQPERTPVDGSPTAGDTNTIQELLDFVSQLLGFDATGLVRPYDPVLDADPVDLVKYWGYPAERHWVTTDDGYVLCVHRVPCSPRDAEATSTTTSRPSRPVVLLGHSFLGSSADFVVQGPGKSIAFLLADAGYDAWLINFRGNTYSRNHTTLDPDEDAEFWNFSYEEHGLYDLPTTIKYVMQCTGQDQMHYLGFSMGGTSMLITGALVPDTAKHIKLFTALAPAATLTNMRSALVRAIGVTTRTATAPDKLTGVPAVASREALPSTLATRRGGEVLCADGAATQPLCSALLNAIGGKNTKVENTTMYPEIFARYPAGTSLKTLNHFAQSIVSGFKHYDYGTVENLKRYGNIKAPAYDLTKVAIPVRFNYGMNDLLVDYTNVQVLCKTVANALSCDAVPDADWTHLDFVGAESLPAVNKKIVAEMQAFDSGST